MTKFSCLNPSVIFSYSLGALSIIDAISLNLSPAEPYTSLLICRAAWWLASLSPVKITLKHFENVFIRGWGLDVGVTLVFNSSDIKILNKFFERPPRAKKIPCLPAVALAKAGMPFPQNTLIFLYLKVFCISRFFQVQPAQFF